MQIVNEAINCPLCDTMISRIYHTDKWRNYYRCNNCALVSVPEIYWLAPKEEKAVYDLHYNDPNDKDYLQFLSRLVTPLLERLSPESEGLDFGCGPGPALAKLFTQHGHTLSLYDPYYFNNSELLTRQYDFICATEVVEHLRRPKEIFSSLFAMLRSSGWLGIMTKRVRNQEAFKNWHYIRDLTHICFFSKQTFTLLGQWYNSTPTFIGDDVVLFTKE